MILEVQFDDDRRKRKREVKIFNHLKMTVEYHTMKYFTIVKIDFLGKIHFSIDVAIDQKNDHFIANNPSSHFHQIPSLISIKSLLLFSPHLRKKILFLFKLDFTLHRC